MKLQSTLKKIMSACVLLRAISLSTAMIFIVSELLFFPSQALAHPYSQSSYVRGGTATNPLASASAQRTTSFSGNAQEIVIPPELGFIQESYQGSSGKMVLYLQDAHAVPEAQKALEALIEYLQKTYGVQNIALEGAEGKLDPTLFRIFPDQKKLQQTFRRYLEAGEISGAAAASVLSPVSGHYYGIENWALYEKGVEAFLKALSGQAEVQTAVDELQEKATELKMKFYSRQAYGFDREIGRWENSFEQLPALLSYIQTLMVLDPEKYPTLVKVAKNIRDLSIDDRSRFGSETQRLLRKIESELTGKDQKFRFNGLQQSFRTGRIGAGELICQLEILLPKAQLNLSPGLQKAASDYKALTRYDSAAFLKEWEECLEEARAKIFLAPEEREMSEIADQIEKLMKLARLELSWKEWEALQRVSSSHFDQVGESAIQNLGEKVQKLYASDLLKDHLRFYELSAQRDDAFFDRFQELFKRADLAISVTGGFHVSGLTEKFKQRSISYVVISPRVKRLPETNRYLDYMQGQVSWKGHFKSRSGEISLYEAFCNATMEQLTGSYATNEFSALAQKNQLKLWRDEVIRILAEEGHVEDSLRYTRFIDHALVRLQPKSLESLRSKWTESLNDLIQKLQVLGKQNEINERQVMRLLSGNTVFPAAVASFQPDAVLPERFFKRIASSGTKNRIPSEIVIPEPATAEKIFSERFFETQEALGESVSIKDRPESRQDIHLPVLIGVAVAGLVSAITFTALINPDASDLNKALTLAGAAGFLAGLGGYALEKHWTRKGRVSGPVSPERKSPSSSIRPESRGLPDLEFNLPAMGDETSNSAPGDLLGLILQIRGLKNFKGYFPVHNLARLIIERGQGGKLEVFTDRDESGAVIQVTVAAESREAMLSEVGSRYYFSGQKPFLKRYRLEKNDHEFESISSAPDTMVVDYQGHKWMRTSRKGVGNISYQNVGGSEAKQGMRFLLVFLMPQEVAQATGPEKRPEARRSRKIRQHPGLSPAELDALIQTKPDLNAVPRDLEIAKRQWQWWSASSPKWTDEEKTKIPQVIKALYDAGINLRGGTIQMDQSQEGTQVVEKILGIPRTPASVYAMALKVYGSGSEEKSGWEIALAKAGINPEILKLYPGAIEERNMKLAKEAAEKRPEARLRQSLLNHPEFRNEIRETIRQNWEWIERDQGYSYHQKRSLEELARKLNEQYLGDEGSYPLTDFEIKQYRKALSASNPSYYDDAQEVAFYLGRREYYRLSNAPNDLMKTNPALYQAALREGWTVKKGRLHGPWPQNPRRPEARSREGIVIRKEIDQYAKQKKKEYDGPWLRQDNEMIKDFRNRKVIARRLPHAENIFQVLDPATNEPRPGRILKKIRDGRDAKTHQNEVAALLWLARDGEVQGVPRVAHIGRIDFFWNYLETEGISNGVSLDRYAFKNAERLWSAFLQMAKILRSVHQKGISHNDIKPGNVLISPEGEVMLSDFDLASVFGEETKNGTPGYRSPEPIKTEKSDVFGLAMTLAEMLQRYIPLTLKADRPKLKNLQEMILHAIFKKLPSKIPSNTSIVELYQKQPQWFEALPAEERISLEALIALMERDQSKVKEILFGLNREDFADMLRNMDISPELNLLAWLQETEVEDPLRPESREAQVKQMAGWRIRSAAGNIYRLIMRYPDLSSLPKHFVRTGDHRLQISIGEFNNLSLQFEIYATWFWGLGVSLVGVHRGQEILRTSHVGRTRQVLQDTQREIEHLRQRVAFSENLIQRLTLPASLRPESRDFKKEDQERIAQVFRDLSGMILRTAQNGKSYVVRTRVRNWNEMGQEFGIVMPQTQIFNLETLQKTPVYDPYSIAIEYLDADGQLIGDSRFLLAREYPGILVSLGTRINKGHRGQHLRQSVLNYLRDHLPPGVEMWTDIEHDQTLFEILRVLQGKAALPSGLAHRIRAFLAQHEKTFEGKEKSGMGEILGHEELRQLKELIWEAYQDPQNHLKPGELAQTAVGKVGAVFGKEQWILPHKDPSGAIKIHHRIRKSESLRPESRMIATGIITEKLSPVVLPELDRAQISARGVRENELEFQVSVPPEKAGETRQIISRIVENLPDAERRPGKITVSGVEMRKPEGWADAETVDDAAGVTLTLSKVNWPEEPKEDQVNAWGLYIGHLCSILNELDSSKIWRINYKTDAQGKSQEIREEITWGVWMSHRIPGLLQMALGFAEYFSKAPSEEVWKMAEQAFADAELILASRLDIRKKILENKWDQFPVLKDPEAGKTPEKALNRVQLTLYNIRKGFIDSPDRQRNKEVFVEVLSRMEKAFEKIREYMKTEKNNYQAWLIQDAFEKFTVPEGLEMEMAQGGKGWILGPEQKEAIYQELRALMRRVGLEKALEDIGIKTFVLYPVSGAAPNRVMLKDHSDVDLSLAVKVDSPEQFRQVVKTLRALLPGSSGTNGVNASTFYQTISWPASSILRRLGVNDHLDIFIEAMNPPAFFANTDDDRLKRFYEFNVPMAVLLSRNFDLARESNEIREILLRKNTEEALIRQLGDIYVQELAVDYYHMEFVRHDQGMFLRPEIDLAQWGQAVEANLGRSMAGWDEFKEDLEHYSREISQFIGMNDGIRVKDKYREQTAHRAIGNFSVIQSRLLALQKTISPEKLRKALAFYQKLKSQTPSGQIPIGVLLKKIQDDEQLGYQGLLGQPIYYIFTAPSDALAKEFKTSKENLVLGLLLDLSLFQNESRPEARQNWAFADRRAVLMAFGMFVVIGSLEWWFSDAIAYVVERLRNEIQHPDFIKNLLTSVIGVFVLTIGVAVALVGEFVPRVTKFLVQRTGIRTEGTETYLKTLGIFFSFSSFVDKTLKVFLGLLFIKSVNENWGGLSTAALVGFLFSGGMIRVLTAGVQYRITKDPYLRRIGWLCWMWGIGSYVPLLMIFGSKLFTPAPRSVSPEKMSAPSVAPTKLEIAKRPEAKRLRDEQIGKEISPKLLTTREQRTLSSVLSARLRHQRMEKDQLSQFVRMAAENMPRTVAGLSRIFEEDWFLPNAVVTISNDAQIDIATHQKWQELLAEKHESREKFKAKADMIFNVLLEELGSAIREQKVARMAPVIFYVPDMKDPLMQFIRTVRESFVQAGDDRAQGFRMVLISSDRNEIMPFISELAKQNLSQGVEHYVLDGTEASRQTLITELEHDVFKNEKFRESFGIFFPDETFAEKTQGYWPRTVQSGIGRLGREYGIRLLPKIMLYLAETPTSDINPTTLRQAIPDFINSFEFRSGEGIQIIAGLLETIAEAEKQVSISA